MALVPASRERRGEGERTRFDAFLAWAGRIGAHPDDSADRALQKRLTVLLSLGLLPFTLAWSAIYLVAGAPIPAAVPALYSLLTPIATIVFAWSRNLGLYRFGQLSMFLLLPWALMMTLGGFQESAVVVIWAALCPLAALLVEDLRRTTLWIVAFVLLLILSAILQPHLTPAGLPEVFITWFFVLNTGGVIGVAFVLLRTFVGQRNFFQERSEMLLLNILPKEVSEALKAGPRTIAAQHDAASILFADVVGFTPVAAGMSAMRLVDLLNDVFQCFDDLVDAYGLEKIKTIGDCYMVAAGVPRPRADHAVALVGMALDMRSAVATRCFGGRKLALRIGINSGQVVAGVIGRKKFTYDLWGEAVNTASRMESQGEEGCIQITRATYELVKGAFVCEPRGSIKVKGAKMMEIWHVTGRRTP